MFGNMSWITTKTESKNAESVERLSVCSPADWWGFLFGVFMKAQKLIEKLGRDKVTDILKKAHPGAVYYVDEWNDHFKVHGYCADKCIVGINNPHTHYKLLGLQEALG